MFGYFFGPIQPELPSLADVKAHSAGDAVMVVRFSDKALRSGRWPVVGSCSRWERSASPMPAFHTPQSHWLTGQRFAVQYLEDSPDLLVGQHAIAKDQEADYPPDEGLLPPSTVEHRLDGMLRGR